MRDLLTALAIVLIVALTAALAAPYFVDWNAQRSFVEARLSHALGQKVTIGGAIDVKLLPTPYLMLDQAVIGGDEGPISMGIRHLRLELAVAPLLHGEFEVVEARLEEPTIRVLLQPDRSVPPLPPAPAFKADVRFDRVAVTDGTVALADPESGRTLALEHLDFEAEAGSLAGPFKGSGATGVATARTAFRFASTAVQEGQTRTRLIVEETRLHPGLDLDGVLSLAGPATTAIRPTFQGTIAVSSPTKDPGADTLPWRVSGPFRADASHAALRGGELRLGAETRSVTLSANGDADFGAVPNTHLALTAKQLDLDRLASGVTVSDPEAAVAMPLPLAVLERSLTPPLPMSVDVSIAAATYAGASLSDLSASAALGGAGAPSPARLSLAGPGGLRLAFDGAAGTRPTVSLRGTLAVAATDAPTARAWLARIAPGIALPDLPFRAVTARTAITLDGEGGEAKGLTLDVDGSSLRGDVRYHVARDQHPATMVVDLAADALALDALPDLTALRVASAGADLDLRFEARTVAVARLRDGRLDAGHLTVALSKTGDHVALTTFRIEGLGGAAIEATAVLDASGGQAKAMVDADKLVEVADLARRIAPGAWTDALVKRAPALAPAKLAISAAFAGPGSSWVPRVLAVHGVLGLTKVDADVSPDPADAGMIVATGSATAPDGSVLLRQIGVPALPLAILGESRIDWTARGRADGDLSATIHAALGDTGLDFVGPVTMAGDAHASGSLRLASANASPLLQSLAVAFPDLTGRFPVDLSAALSWTSAGWALADIKGSVDGRVTSGSVMGAGDAKRTLKGKLTVDRLALADLFSLSLGPARRAVAGALWSSEPFGGGLIDPPNALLDLTVETLDLGQGFAAGDAAFQLGVSQDLVSLTGFAAHVAGGDVRGEATLRRSGVNAALDGKLVLNDVRLALPDVSGRVDAQLDLAGSGASALALVSSLGGSGAATLRDLRVEKADPAALPRLVDEIEGDRLALDDASVSRALTQSAGALTSVTQPFALNLAAGVLHWDAPPNPDRESGPVRNQVSATLALRTLTLDARLAQALQALPKDWSGPQPEIVAILAGPLRAPARTIDVSAFTNAFAARSLARESARIEAYEAEARERAFFNQRLQADRRRDQDRLKVEEDVRAAVDAAQRVEADRRAREAAARAERARKAEEAAHASQDRAAQDRAAQDKLARDKASQQREQRVSPQDPTRGGVDQPAFRAPGTPTDPAAAGRY